MNKRLLLKTVPVLVGALAVLGLPAGMAFAAKVGDKAPDFSGTDSQGKTHKLSEYRGKYVVLEWLNHGCPYVKKHYGSKNMQSLQKQWSEKGVVWLSVISSAKGKQGHGAADAVNQTAKEVGANPTAILLDEGGTIGKAYGAKVTPHMFVIDPKGKLVYAGAIDDKPSTEPDTVAEAKNYVSAALTASMAGKKVDPAITQAYGCNVKYE